MQVRQYGRLLVGILTYLVPNIKSANEILFDRELSGCYEEKTKLNTLLKVSWTFSVVRLVE